MMRRSDVHFHLLSVLKLASDSSLPGPGREDTNDHLISRARGCLGFIGRPSRAAYILDWA